MAELKARDDLTLLPELGRWKRDVIADELPTVSALAKCNVNRYVTGKKTMFRGVGLQTFQKFHERAKLVTTPKAKPYRTREITLPTTESELFFDIEVDPMHDFCYLHGFVVRL